MYFFSVEMYIQYYDRCTFFNYVIYLSSKQVNSLRAYASENCANLPFLMHFRSLFVHLS